MTARKLIGWSLGVLVIVIVCLVPLLVREIMAVRAKVAATPGPVQVLKIGVPRPSHTEVIDQHVHSDKSPNTLENHE